MFSTSQGNPSIPAFIGKLWHMVSNPKSDNHICWSQSGTSFIIKDNAKFSSELLPTYYKHNNMASFIRQLNKYGFHKVVYMDSSNNNDRELEFAHPDFIKDRPELILNIKRKPSSKETEFKGDSKLVSKLLQNVQQLQAKQNIFESKLKVMKSENDALWKELSILRQKHHKQQKIVNKLVQFLVILMQQTRGVNVNKFVPLMLKDGRPYLMSIKDSDYNKTPLICEIDVNDTQRDNALNNAVPIKITTAPSPNSDVGKDVINSLISSVNDDELITVNIPSTSSGNEILLDESLPTSTASVSDFVLPVEKDSLLDNNQLDIDSSATASITVPKNQLVITDDKASQSSDKRSLKRKKSSSKTFKKKDCLLMVPELSDEKKYNEVKDPLDISLDCDIVPDAATGTYTLNTDDGTVLVLSPSSETNSSALSSSTEPNNKELISLIEEPVTNNDTSIVTSGFNNPIMNKEDLNYHLDMVQNDLDILKDVLRTENLSLDSSTLMGFFNADDPFSLNLPEFNKTSTNQDDENNENQIIAYSPSNLIDFGDMLDDHFDDFVNVQSSATVLSTPLIEDNSSLSPENKRIKK